MSTFGSFSTVKLGIYAAQKGLDVTGNNITNINTEGYTRQRLQQTSLVTSAADRYYSIYKTRVGQGVVTTGVTQLREPGLDLAYRNSTSDLGAADAKLAGLEDLAQILDEVGKGDLEQDDGVILNQLNDLRDLINEAITNGIEEYDGLIRTSAQALCTLFNSTANSLTELQGRYEERLTQQVDTINSILTNLRDLNVSIRNADIRGDNALELRDERNRLLDELSQYVKIDVQYTMEDVGAGFMVEKMTVSWTYPGQLHTPHEANMLRLDCSKMKSFLGWRPLWNVSEAVRQTVAWTRVWQTHGDIKDEMCREIQLYQESMLTLAAPQ